MDVAADEGAAYRLELETMSIEEINLDLVRWYLTRLPRWSSASARQPQSTRAWTSYYEDLFGLAETRDALSVYRHILGFLGYSDADRHFDRLHVGALLGEGGKLNTADFLRRVPNHAEIERRFGPRG